MKTEKRAYAVVRDEKWRKSVLAFDPFGGDREESRLLRDKILMARRPGPCNMCAGEIKPGEMVRAIAEIVEGHPCTNRFCLECCDAMAADDDGAAIDKRALIGYERRGPKRNAQ